MRGSLLFLAMNSKSLFVLQPYRYQSAWVVDDSRVGLEREPFVFGVDEIIDCLGASVPDAAHGFRMIFSTQAFPDCAAKLEWCREEAHGSRYFSPAFGIAGWLYSALFKYFGAAPKVLHAKQEALLNNEHNEL